MLQNTMSADPFYVDFQFRTKENVSKFMNMKFRNNVKEKTVIWRKMNDSYSSDPLID